MLHPRLVSRTDMSLASLICPVDPQPLSPERPVPLVLPAHTQAASADYLSPHLHSLPAPPPHPSLSPDTQALHPVPPSHLPLPPPGFPHFHALYPLADRPRLPSLLSLSHLSLLLHEQHAQHAPPSLALVDDLRDTPPSALAPWSTAQPAQRRRRQLPRAESARNERLGALYLLLLVCASSYCVSSD